MACLVYGKTESDVDMNYKKKRQFPEFKIIYFSRRGRENLSSSEKKSRKRYAKRIQTS